MTIIQQPAAYELSGNLKPLILSSGEELMIDFYIGETRIFSGSYNPDGDSRIEIDLSRIFHNQMEIAPPGSEEVIVADIPTCRIKIARQEGEVTFKLVKGGVDGSIAAGTFLKANFLTWRPQSMGVAVDSPIFLSYAALEVCHLNVTAHFADGTNQAKTIYQCQADKRYTFNLSFAVIGKKFAGRQPSWFDVYVSSPEGEKRSFTQRFYLVHAGASDDIFVFENSLGGFDQISFGGKKREASDLEVDSAVLADDTTIDYDSNLKRGYVKDTGYFETPVLRNWVSDFLRSPKKFHLCNGALCPIVITESDVASDRFTPSAYSFTFAYARQSPFLNLPRLEALPEVVEIIDPDGSVFPLAPRLYEFPVADVGADPLILVQHPFEDTWRYLPFSRIRQVVTSLIQHIKMITLGDATPPTDSNVFSALRSRFEFLNKNVADAASEKITFRKGLQVGPSFVPGLTGAGGLIDEAGNAELESLKLRTFLEVPELRFNRIDVVSGELWNAIAFGMIESVDTLNKVCTLKLEVGEYGNLHVGDLCRGIFHNLTSVSNAIDGNKFEQIKGFATAYFTPTEVIENSPGVFAFKYDLQPGMSVHPCPVMKFAVYGHPTAVDRQNSAYTTRGYQRCLKGVNTWKIEAKNIAAQYGDLSSLNLFGLDMTGYSSYQDNVYFGGNLQFVDKFWEKILEESPNYSVALTQSSVSVKAGEPIKTTLEVYRATTLQTALVQGETATAGKYLVALEVTNCTAAVTEGVLTLSAITDPSKTATVDVTVNCEGRAVYKRLFTAVIVADGTIGQSPYRLELSSYSYAIPCDAAGNIINVQRMVDTTATLWLGQEDVTASAVFTADGNGATVFQKGNTFELLTLHEERAKVAITATVNGVAVGTAIWTLAKVRQGSSVVWKGELSAPPPNPQKDWVYRNSTNGIVYIYNGISWNMMVTDGNDGVDGKDGNSVFITYHDNPASTKPGAPTGTGTTGGWHTAPTENCVWMSQKVSTSASSGTWGNPIRIGGTSGSDGTIGVSVRWSDYNSSTQYYSGWENGDNAVTNPLRYKDYVTTDSGNQVVVTECIRACVNTSPPNGIYWKSISYAPVIATKLLLSENAVIAGWNMSKSGETKQVIMSKLIGERILLDGANNRIVIGTGDFDAIGVNSAGICGSGTTGTAVRIFAGNNNPDIAPFRVQKNGHVIMPSSDIGNWVIRENKLDTDKNIDHLITMQTGAQDSGDFNQLLLGTHINGAWRGGLIKAWSNTRGTTPVITLDVSAFAGGNVASRKASSAIFIRHGFLSGIKLNTLVLKGSQTLSEGCNCVIFNSASQQELLLPGMYDPAHGYLLKVCNAGTAVGLLRTASSYGILQINGTYSQTLSVAAKSSVEFVYLVGEIHGGYSGIWVQL